MHVRVLLFAGLRERLRSDSVTLVLPGDPSVGQLVAALAEQHPVLRALLPLCRVAVNHEFVATASPSVSMMERRPPGSNACIRTMSP